MRVLVDTDLDKKLLKSGVDDAQLCVLATEIQNGIHDGVLVTNLLFKKRIGVQGQGARDGLRGVVAHKHEGNLFFIDVYHKNKPPKKTQKERKDPREIPVARMKIYKELAQSLLAADAAEIKVMIKNGEFREVNCNG